MSLAVSPKHILAIKGDAISLRGDTLDGVQSSFPESQSLPESPSNPGQVLLQLALDIFCNGPNGCGLFQTIALRRHHLVQTRQLRYVMGIPQVYQTHALRVLEKELVQRSLYGRQMHPTARQVDLLGITRHLEATRLKVKPPAAPVHQIAPDQIHEAEAIHDDIGIEVARSDATPDARHAFRTGICRSHLQADVPLFQAEVHDAPTRLFMGPPFEFWQRIVHATHDDVAGEKKRDRKAK